MKTILILSILFSSMTFHVALASDFDGKQASCSGDEDGVKVSLQLQFNNQKSDTFYLTIQRSGAPEENSSGEAKMGGGDGMNMATLTATDTQATKGTLRWWDTMIPPNLSLTGEANLIPLKCEGLPIHL